MANVSIRDLTLRNASSLSGGEEVEWDDGVSYGRLNLKQAIEKWSSSSGSSLQPQYGFAAIGASNTAAPTNWNVSWPKKVEFFSNGRHRLRLNPSVGGYTVPQIRDLLLPQVLALNPLPKECIMSGGTNSLTSDSAMATGIEALHDVIVTLLENNVEPVLFTTHPQISSGRSARVARWNAELWRLNAEFGFKIIDAYGYFSDPATGLAKANTYDDDLHPSAEAHVNFAKWIVEQKILSSVVPHPLAPSNVDPRNKFPNGWLLTESETPGLSEGFAVINPESVMVPSRVLDPDGFYWQELFYPSGSLITDSIEWRLPTNSIVAGHKYLINVAMKYTGPVEGPSMEQRTSCGLLCLWRKSTWGSAGSAPLGQRFTTDTESGVISDIVEAPAEANFATFSLSFHSGNTAPLETDLKVSIARPYMIDLTEAGLV